MIKFADARDRIFVALDVPGVLQALELVDLLKGSVGGFKVGLELTRSMIPDLLDAIDVRVDYRIINYARAVQRFYDLLGGRYFDDSKLDDIDNTVAGASRQIARLKPWAFNVHASAGRAAVRAAVQNRGNSQVLGVTVLTSLKEECKSIFGDDALAKVISFSELLLDEGASGIICSAQEAAAIRALSKFDDLILVTPAIRPEWAAAAGQKRPVTPADAVRAGADYLVIGRPITQPPPEISSPLDAVRLIVEEIQTASS